MFSVGGVNASALVRGDVVSMAVVMVDSRGDDTLFPVVHVCEGGLCRASRGGATCWQWCFVWLERCLCNGGV